jgi:subtilisin-like proprotein convertase family protein
MKKLSGILLLLVTLASRADMTNLTLTATPNLVVSDGNPAGLTSRLNVSGMSGLITDTTVDLNVTGGFNGNLYADLVSPQGKMVVLLNPAGMSSGNYFGSGNTVSLNITAGGQLAYTWMSASQTIAPSYSVPDAFDAAPTSSTLADLDDSSPNGDWTLFVADLSGGSQSTVVSWGLTVMTVPEPQTWILVGGSLATFWMMTRQRWD